MYFGRKSYLKNTRNHTAKHALKPKLNLSKLNKITKSLFDNMVEVAFQFIFHMKIY